MVIKIPSTTAKLVHDTKENKSDLSVQQPNVADEAGQKLPVEAGEGTQVESPEDLNNALDKVNESMQVMSRDILFTFDEETNRSVILIHDKATGEVIRQIPTKEVLKMAQNLREMAGYIFKQNV